MRYITTTLACIAIALACGPRQTFAQRNRAYDLIKQVNQLRAEYDLPPYQISAALMDAAQSHSEWAASVGFSSHVEPDGSRPRDRAIASGYGDGDTVWVSENIYWSGSSPTTDRAMEWWRNSPVHFQGLTSDRYQEIGAGVAFQDNSGYFTLLFGIRAGYPSTDGKSDSASINVETELLPAPGDLIEPGLIATLNIDGSIVHTVRRGEYLTLIAEAYGVDYLTLLTLNSLTEESILYTGDQIVIKPPTAYSPLATTRIPDTGSGGGTATPAVMFEVATATHTPAAIAEADGIPADELETGVDRGLVSAGQETASRSAIIIVLVAIITLGGVMILTGMRALKLEKSTEPDEIL